MDRALGEAQRERPEAGQQNTGQRAAASGRHAAMLAQQTPPHTERGKGEHVLPEGRVCLCGHV